MTRDVSLVPFLFSAIFDVTFEPISTSDIFTNGGTTYYADY